jgi:hypothetical protein
MPNEIEIEQNVSVSSDDSIDEIDAEEIAQILAEAQLILAYKLPTEIVSHAVQIKLSKIQHLFRSVINSTPNFIKWLAGLTPSGSALVISASHLLETVFDEKQQGWIDFLGNIPTISPAILHVCAALLIFKNRWAAKKDLEVEQEQVIKKINALVREVFPEIDGVVAQEVKDQANALFGATKDRVAMRNFKQTLLKKTFYPPKACFLPSVLISIATIVPQALRFIVDRLQGNGDASILYNSVRVAASVLNVGISIAILVALIKKSRVGLYNKGERERLFVLEETLQKAQKAKQELSGKRATKFSYKIARARKIADDLIEKTNGQKDQIKQMAKVIKTRNERHQNFIVTHENMKHSFIAEKQALNDRFSDINQKYGKVCSHFKKEKARFIEDKQRLSSRIEKSKQQYNELKNEYNKREREISKERDEFKVKVSEYEADAKRQKIKIVKLNNVLSEKDKNNTLQGKGSNKSELLQIGYFSKKTMVSPDVAFLTKSE